MYKEIEVSYYNKNCIHFTKEIMKYKLHDI